MGHLVNPIAMRMGVSQNWIDLLFVDRKYYPQYLHMLFRLRIFLNFIFRDHWFERRAGFFYSHFLLTKDYSGISLGIFFYDGKTEAFFYVIEDYIKEDRTFLYQNLDYKNYHTKKSDTFFLFYLFFIFFRLFNHFYITYNWSKQLLKHQHIERIAQCFFIFDQKMMRSALQLKDSPSRKKKRSIALSIDRCQKTHMRFFFFYLICRDLALLHDLSNVRLRTTIPELTHIFTFIYCMLSRNNFIFRTLRPYVTFLMNYLASTLHYSSLDFIEVHFLAITNENVTADFISRYIAVKLRQGFTTRSLLNPLRREFNRLIRLDANPQKIVRLPFEFFLRRYFNRRYFSSLFRNVLKKLQLFYCSYNNSLFSSRKSKISFDSFLFLKYAYKKVYRNRSSLKARRVTFNLCSKYWNCYFFFAFFYYNKISIYYTILINNLFRQASKIAYYVRLGHRIPLFLFPSIVPKIVFNDFENHSNWEGYSSLPYKNSLLFLFLKSFRNKMHLLYSEQNQYYLARSTSAKNRLLRLRHYDKAPEKRLGFRGFKIQCLGRFTRKQRSAKLTWIKNGVPLNTISANIDYGTFSVVLKNSIINVKVWFHKDEGFSEYYLKLL